MFYACNAQGGRAAMRYSIDAPLAMAYVPMQVWRNLYSARDALAQGHALFRAESALPGKGGTAQCLLNSKPACSA